LNFERQVDDLTSNGLMAPGKQKALSARLDILNVLNRSHSQQQPNTPTTQHVHKTSANKR